MKALVSVAAALAVMTGVSNAIASSTDTYGTQNVRYKIELLKLTQFISDQIQNETIESLKNPKPEFSSLRLKIKNENEYWYVTRAEGTDIPCQSKYRAVYHGKEILTFIKAGQDQCPAKQ